jgi:integrase/recombinase XerD
MSPTHFQDDLAEWDLCTGKGLVNDLDAWRDRYITEKVAQGVSDKTRKSYGEALTPLIEFAHQYDSIMDLEGMSAKFVNNYLMWYQEQLSAKDLEANKISMDEYNQVLSNRKANRGKNDAKLSIVYRYEKSISHRLTVLKQLLLFISENNKENKDFTPLFKYFTKIKVQKRKTEFVTENELEELIDFMKHWPEIYKKHFPKSSERYAYRNALIVLLYCLTGARADEVISLNMEHINESEYKDDNGITHLFYTIAYHTTKGDKYREVVVRREEIELFVEYMSKNLPDGSFTISSTYANGSYTNKKMADVEMWKFTTFALKAIGGNKSGRHIIRRGYATKELADGKDLAIVAMELGHTSTNTTFSAYVKNNPELMMRQKLK